MKLMFATLTVALIGLGAAGVAAAEGDDPPPPCNPYHEQCGPPDPHGGPTCENGGTVVWLNAWHFICVPDNDCNYERRTTHGR